MRDCITEEQKQQRISERYWEETAAGEAIYNLCRAYVQVYEMGRCTRPSEWWLDQLDQQVGVLTVYDETPVPEGPIPTLDEVHEAMSGIPEEVILRLHEEPK